MRRLGSALAGALLCLLPPGTPIVAAAGDRSDFIEAPHGVPLPAREPLDPRFGIAEGFRRPAVMASIGAGWQRVVLSWAQIQPDGPGDFSWLGRTLPHDPLAVQTARGVRTAGLLQFTPAWAQANPEHGERSVPRNLYRPFTDPENYFARFVYETVRYYRGRIDEWIIWNEVEFQPGDAGAGGSYTWLGTDKDFARLLQVGYLAAKWANPDARVSFPGTSYWVEELSSPRRPHLYDRILAIYAKDPDSAAQGFYHDALSLNLYRTPDDVLRVQQVFRDIQARHGVHKPMWLLELNAMPSDDREIPCAERHRDALIQTTMQQQAAYAVQALAMAAAAGYERISFYKMVDGDTCLEPAVWGVTRDDGSLRPVARSLMTAVEHFSHFTTARFAPLPRPVERYPAWPGDPSSYTPNWQIYQVALDLPGARRVRVLWNGDGIRHQVRVPIQGQGSTSRLIDHFGNELPLSSSGANWLIDLPAATARFEVNAQLQDPPGYHFIGGAPRLLIEDRVPPATSAVPPRLG